MAKDKKKKAARRKKDRSAPETKSPGSPRRAKVSKAVKATRAKAAELASNPVVTEVVAAILLAAAAALRSPQKGRAMAAAAGEELQGLAAESKGRGGLLWQLALDVARRSLEESGSATKGDAPRQKKAKSGKKKKKGKT